MRYGPNQVIFNDTTSIKDIYAVTKSANIRKGPQYRMLHGAGGATSTHSEIDREIHAVRRRILGHGFSEHALKTLEPFMEQNINLWLEKLGSGAEESSKGWTPARNMAEWANYLTMDVLGDLCFGKSFDMLTSPTNRPISTLLPTRAKLFHTIGRSTVLQPLFTKFLEPYGIVKYLSPKTARDLAQFKSFSATSMKQRLAVADAEKALDEDEARKDFVYYLLRGSDPVSGYAPSQSEFMSEALLLITAGSDTTSITIAATFYYLARYPTVLAKLQHELRSNFSSVEEIVNGPQLAKCTYLRAVIEEALRVNPPVGSSMQRQVTKGGVSINGEYFGEGTLVGGSIFAIQHNERYYRDPFSFRPERWIAEQGTEAEKDEIALAKSAFCPFSLGNRGCIGRQMAYNELSMALGRVFYQYDIRLKEGDHTGEGYKDEYDLFDAFVAFRDGPMIEFRKVGA